MMKRHTLAAAIAAALVSGPAAAVHITWDFKDSNSVGNTWASDGYPTEAPDGALVLYSWADRSEEISDPAEWAKNSKRTYTYQGAKPFVLDEIVFSGEAFNNFHVTHGSSWVEELRVAATKGTTTYFSNNNVATEGVHFTSGNGEALADRTDGKWADNVGQGTTVGSAHDLAGLGFTAAQRLVNPGETITFEFFEDVSDGVGPDATYGENFRVELFGETQSASMALGGNVNTANNTVDFGTVRLGTSESRTVSVTNTGTEQSILSDVVLGGAADANFTPDGDTAPVDRAKNESVTRDYTFTPGGLGTDSDTISLTANDSGDNLSEVVTLTGVGVTPIFDLKDLGTSGTLNFGNVDLASTAVKDMIVRNLFGTDYGADTDLTILSVGITGSSDFSFEGANPGTFEVNANGSASFLDKLKFLPTVAGLQQATLTFLTDVGVAKGASGASYSFTLQGTGQVSGGSGGGGGGVPAPGTLLLLGVGLAGLRAVRPSR